MLCSTDRCAKILPAHLFHDETSGFGFRFEAFIHGQNCYSVTIGFSGYESQELRDADLFRWYLAMQRNVVGEA